MFLTDIGFIVIDTEHHSLFLVNEQTKNKDDIKI